MRHILLAMLLYCSIPNLLSQDFQANDIIYFPGEYNSHELFHKDMAGNKFIAGRGTGPIDFDFGAGANALPENSYRDLYLTKYDAANNLDWLLSFDGTVVSNQIRAMVTDDEGNIYVGGAFSGTLNLTNDGQNELSNFGSSSMFVAKFDPNGNLLWHFKIGDTNFSQYPDKMYLVNNRLIIQFVYSGTFDVDPGSGTTMFSGSSNAMLVFNLDGSLLEANSHKGGTNVRASALDDEGNLYIGGLFSGLASFDYKSNASVFATGLFDAYVAKYDANFNLIWLKSFGKDFETLSFEHLAIDSENNVVAAAIFAEDTNVGSLTAENDANYLVNVSSEGVFEQLIEILPESSFVWDLLINSEDQIILSADFDETIDMDPSAEVQEISPMMDHDNHLLAVYEPDYTLTGVGQIYAPNLNTRSIFLDEEDEIDVLIDFESEGRVVFGNESTYTVMEEENFVYYNLDIGGCSATMGDIFLEVCNEAIIDGDTISTSGNYQQILINSDGCDSILNIDVTVYPNYEFFQDIESCGPFESDGVIYSVSGTYTLLLTSIHGCDSTVIFDLGIIDIDKAITIEDNVIYASESDGDAYQWYDCNTNMPIENATNISFAPENDGSYRVEITKSSCTETSECIDFNLVNTTDLGFDFQVFPNPSQGFLQINISGIDQELKVSILDLSGREVMPTKHFHKNDILDLSQINSGLYLLKLEGEDGIGIRKITLE